jgi:hypothetical protein
MSTNYDKPTSAEPHDGALVCTHCGLAIKRIPVGDGVGYVHNAITSTGYRACRAEDRATFLVTTILAETDRILPVIVAHLDDLNMDTPEDEALLQQIRDLVNPWHEHVLTLRAMSHR